MNTLQVTRDMEINSELFCLVCNTKLEVTSCVNIFYTSLPRNGTQLGSFILQVLRCFESDLRSSYVCSQCFGLFQMLEQAQWTAANIRTEILKVYESGSKQKDIRIESNDNSNLFGINNKCLVDYLGQKDKLKITNDVSQPKNISDLKTAHIDECSTIQEKLAIVCEESLHQNRQTSDVHVNLNANLSQSVSQILIKSTKLNVGSSSVSISSGNNLKNDQNVRDEKFQIKIERSDLGAGNIDSDALIDDLSNEILNQNQGLLREEPVDDSSKNQMTLNLNRQEKMALYTHQCKLCGRLFKHANDLHSHLVKHGESQPHKCKICEERFSNLPEANLHAIQEHPGNKDAIDIVTEPQAGELTVLIGDDHGIFPEELLGMSDNEEQDDFEWKEVIHNNEKINENKESISGNDAAQMLDANKKVASNSQKHTYKSGRISKYSLKPLKYPCPTCGKKWRTSAELKMHLKSHSNLRPYMCEKCGQAYKHKHALEIHVGMHNGINPFQCTFCNKCFTQKGALMRHLPMHTGETPYQCELCGKRFVHHTSYNMHALSHTGKKSYQCHVCDLSLLSTSHLKRHMRVHTGEKPFSCTLCGKRFAERYNLFAHQKIHDPAEILAKETKIIQYKCKECAIIFDKKIELDAHFKHYHNVVIESTSNKKWLNNGNEDEIQIPKLYTSTNQNQNQNSIKLDTRENITADEAWQHVSYSKLQNIESDPKLPDVQNTFQIITNPLTACLENHKILMDMGYNRNLISNTPSGNQSPMERS